MGNMMRMDDTAKNINPIGDRVLLKFEELYEDRMMPVEVVADADEDVKVDKEPEMEMRNVPTGVFRAYVHSLGKGIDPSGIDFKVGDWVIFNGNAVTAIDLPDLDNPEDFTKVRRFGMTTVEQIWGLYEA